mmetsp:Transcript_22789/g.73326  ORF Transcript_22789/g.73326 Transcript_22789/m.73326 type:complete len:214 (+) Transcript_22789:463-1104(+)
MEMRPSPLRSNRRKAACTFSSRVPRHSTERPEASSAKSTTPLPSVSNVSKSPFTMRSNCLASSCDRILARDWRMILRNARKKRSRSSTSPPLAYLRTMANTSSAAMETRPVLMRISSKVMSPPAVSCAAPKKASSASESVTSELEEEEVEEEEDEEEELVEEDDEEVAVCLDPFLARRPVLARRRCFFLCRLRSCRPLERGAEWASAARRGFA